MPRSLFSALIIFLLILTQNAAFSQSDTKIGLTLSGGGAKGLAHIGILKAIDSAGLKIDYITGTSMGSIIGSLYAIGYSADSIEAIARSMDWGLLLSNSPYLREITIEEKFEFNRYAAELPYENGGIKFPTGIIEGEELWLKLKELYGPVYNIKDFNQFSIPFACIGTDLIKGEPVVLRNGEISKAVRSSMAIPSVFSPVSMDSLLLVDGGVVRNFPVRDAQAMGANYLIGVNLSNPNVELENMKSIFDVLLQIAFFNDNKDVVEEIALCDLYIQPDLQEFSTGDFAKGNAIVDLGIAEGMKWYPHFKKLADSLNHYQEKTDRLPKIAPIVPVSIEIKGLKETSERFLLGRLNLKAGDSLTIADVNDGIRRAFGTRYYKKIYYSFEERQNEAYALCIEVTENEMTYLKVGIHYDTYTSFGVIGNITSRNSLTQNSRALWSFKLGEFPKSRLQYYQYLGTKQNWGAALEHYLEYNEQAFFDEDYRAQSLYKQLYQHLEFRLQHSLTTSFLLGAGYRVEAYNLFPKVNESLYVKGSNRFQYAFGFLEWNTINRKVFPTKGIMVTANAGYVFNQNEKVTGFLNGVEIIKTDTTDFFSSFGDYAKWTLEVLNYTSISPKSTLLSIGYFGYIQQQDNVFFNEYILGGIIRNNRNQFPVVGLLPGEVRSTSFATLQLGYQYEFVSKMFATPRYSVMVYDFYLDRTSAQQWLQGAGLSVGYASAIGPIEITAMYSPEIRSIRGFVNIGFHF